MLLFGLIHVFHIASSAWGLWGCKLVTNDRNGSQIRFWCHCPSGGRWRGCNSLVEGILSLRKCRHTYRVFKTTHLRRRSHKHSECYLTRSIKPAVNSCLHIAPAEQLHAKTAVGLSGWKHLAAGLKGLFMVKLHITTHPVYTLLVLGLCRYFIKL